MSPTVLRETGFHFFFYSRETNEPPHIHVRKGGAVAKFWLDPVELAEIHAFNPNERRQIIATIVERQEELLGSWYDYFGQDPPGNRR